MRRLAAYFLSMSIVLIILILLDFGIFLGISIGTNENRYFVSAEKVSVSITEDGQCTDSYFITFMDYKKMGKD